LFTVLLGVIELLAPEAVGSGGSFLTQRLALFPAYGALMWLGRQHLRRGELIVAATVAVVAAVGLGAVRHDELRHIELVAADQAAIVNCVPRGATIVQSNLADVTFGSAGRIDALTSETGRLAAERDGIDLANYNWEVPFLLQRFRPETNPYTYLAVGRRFHRVPPVLKFAEFERATRNSVDVVVLWARPRMTDAARRSSTWRRFDRSLRTRYRRTARSPLGWWEVWTRAPLSVTSVEPRDSPSDCLES
jgi:hypothetical protein